MDIFLLETNFYNQQFLQQLTIPIGCEKFIWANSYTKFLGDPQKTTFSFVNKFK